MAWIWGRLLISSRLRALLSLVVLGFMLSGAWLPPFLLAAQENVAGQAFVTHEIRYHVSGAGEVFLVWGVNGWEPVPEMLRPSGTVIKHAIMFTPMQHGVDATFSVRVQAPAGVTITYAFQITKKQDGAAVEVWDTNGVQGRNYHAVATEGKVEEFTAGLELRDEPVVTQEIRYHIAGAEEVFLVWGINNWTPLPEDQRPPGTVIKDAVMHTSMALIDEVFTVKVKVPYGAAIHYAFLITKKNDGAAITVWDANGGPQQDYLTTALPGGIAEVQATVTVTSVAAFARGLGDSLFLLFVVCLLLGGFVFLYRGSRSRYGQRVQAFLCSSRAAAQTILIGLTLLGLGLRLWMAWRTNQWFPDSPARLQGDETSYDGLAYRLTQGEFFIWPGRVPVYPILLAVCYLLFGHAPASVLYVQVFVGVLIIPLTFLLARYFIQETGALVAAALVAVHPALILHVSVLYPEVLYAPLLLLALLGLLRAIEYPRPRRFVFAGVLLAIVNLCRPTAAFFPLLTPWLLPQAWPLTRKLWLSFLSATAMVVVIAPWTYHNYRTYHAFLPFSTSSVVLWMGSPEYYHLMEQKRHNLQIWAEQLNPARNGGHDTFTIEGDRYFATRAVASIKAEPGVYAWYCLQKLAFFWIGHPANDWPSYALFSVEEMRQYFSWPQVFGSFLTRLLPVVALVSLIVLRRRLRDFTLLLAVCGYFMFLHALTIPVVRYSEPLHPLLCIMIAAAVCETPETISLKRQKEFALPAYNNGLGEGQSYGYALEKNRFQLTSAMELLRANTQRSIDELGSLFFLTVPVEKAEYYEQSSPLFGYETAARFPQLTTDISEAGKCFALGRYTSAVFHLRRVMEVGLQAFGDKLGVALDAQKAWQNILEEVNNGIKEMDPENDLRAKSYAETAAHLYNVKLAWRNDVMYPKETYTEEEAERLFLCVKIFIADLA